MLEKCAHLALYIALRRSIISTRQRLKFSLRLVEGMFFRCIWYSLGQLSKIKSFMINLSHHITLPHLHIYYFLTQVIPVFSADGHVGGNGKETGESHWKTFQCKMNINMSSLLWCSSRNSFTVISFALLKNSFCRKWKFTSFNFKLLGRGREAAVASFVIASHVCPRYTLAFITNYMFVEKTTSTF